MIDYRHIARGGLVAGLVAMAAGIVTVGGSAVMAGDWWLARQPWIGGGLTLLVAGLALTAASALVLGVSEPIGRLRLLAVPPALVVGCCWAFMLIVGLPTSGPRGGPERDVRTILYSLPEMLLILGLATLLLVLPLVLHRTLRKR